VEYASTTGVKLVADLYRAEGIGQGAGGHRGARRRPGRTGAGPAIGIWGTYLAKNGYVVLSIE